MKKCVMCKKDKPLTEFNRNRAKADGLQLHCKICSKMKSNEHYVANKQKYKDRSEERKQLIAMFLVQKLKSGCVKCNEKDIVVLDFDHLHDKESGISEMVKKGFGIQVIEKEIEKCQILCANCHRRKTAQERGWRKHLALSTSG